MADGSGTYALQQPEPVWTHDEVQPDDARKLWGGVLLEMWRCALMPVTSWSNVRHKGEARAWFGTRDFVIVCELSGVDPASVMRSYRKALAGCRDELRTDELRTDELRRGARVSIPVMVRGVSYPSLASCARAFGLNMRVVTRALRSGRLDEIGLPPFIPGGAARWKTCDMNGRIWPSQAAAARGLDVAEQTICAAVAAGRKRIKPGPNAMEGLA